jgi:predicted  nucleic acid-binding Zn-ribbon protein
MDIAMDITVELEKAKDRRQKVVDEINELAANIEQIQGKRQLLFQEALKLEGEVRVLERISKDGEKGGEISG